MPRNIYSLLLPYSMRGLQDWQQKASKDLKDKARGLLANEIAESKADIDDIIRGRSREKFIAMPKHGYKGLEWCFFSPRMAKGGLVSLILFVLVNRARKDYIAFRFESSPRGPHGYSHLQLTRRSSPSGSTLPVPQWLPQSYPAFPVPARNWTEMFLVMATAVHGRVGGVDDVLRNILGANDAKPYLETLKKVLVKLP